MQNNDLVTLVDEYDNVLGQMDKIEAHRGEGRLHRAISVFLFRYNEVGELELLIQQRSSLKIVGAEQWANTVCGNVWPGESYEACARRRLRHELGINAEDLQLADVHNFLYQVKCNDEFSEHEMDRIFVGMFGEKVEPNAEEVSKTTWVRWLDVQDEAWRKKSAFKWAPWFELMFQDDKLVEKLRG